MVQNMQLSNLMTYINKLKDRDHMIISVEVEKAS